MAEKVRGRFSLGAGDDSDWDRQRIEPGFTLDVGEAPEVPSDRISGVDLRTLIDMGGMDMNPRPVTPLGQEDFYGNLIDQIPDDRLSTIVANLDQDCDRAKDTRQKFDEIAARGIKETGFDRTSDTRSDPFPGASAVIHPLFAQAAIDFQARTMKSMWPAKGPVNTSIEGDAVDEKLAKAERVKRFMNWQLTVQAPDYRREKDRMYMMLPFVGDAMYKLWWEPLNNSTNGRPRGSYITSDNFIIPYGATDLETAPFYAQDMPMWPAEAEGHMESGLWRKIPLTSGNTIERSKQQENTDKIQGLEPSMDQKDEQAIFREVHVNLFIEDLAAENEAAIEAALRARQPQAQSADVPLEQGDAQGASLPDMPMEAAAADDMVDLSADPNAANLMSQDGPMVDLGLAPLEQEAPPLKKRAVPYVITYHKGTRKAVAVHRNWKKDDPDYKKRMWFKHSQMFPWRGFWGLSLWHLIGGLAKSATGSLRALMDSALVDIMPGGVRLSSANMGGQSISYRPMEFAQIKAPGVDDIRKAVMAFPKNQTSPVMLDLLRLIVEWGGSFATTAMQQVVDIAPNVPATTILQVLEHYSAVYSAIHARLHHAQAEELRLLAELNFENLPEVVSYRTKSGEEAVVYRTDFDGVLVTPASDPEIFSEVQRSMKARALIDAAKEAKEQGVNVDLRYAFVQYVKILSFDDADNLFPEAGTAAPLDPVSEFQAVLQGKPVDAFPGQNHQAHVDFLRAVAQNPNYQQAIQGVLPAFTALGHAHLSMMLRDQVERAIQAQLPQGPQAAQITAQQQWAIAQTSAEAMRAITAQAIENGEGPDGLAGGDPLLLMAEADRERVVLQREKQAHELEKMERQSALDLATLKAKTEDSERNAKIKVVMKQWDIMAALIKHFTALDASKEADAAKFAQGVIGEFNKIQALQLPSDQPKPDQDTRAA